MCTDFILPFGNPYISGRTMDFGDTLNARICKIAENRQFQSSAPNDQPGKKWTGKYGFIGINYKEVDMYSDGLNTEGLSVALLWLGAAKYVTPTAAEAPQCVTITDTVAFFLSTCSTVDDVKTALAGIVVWGKAETALGGVVPTLHIVAHDKNGKTLVVEFVEKAGTTEKEVLCYEYTSANGQDTWSPGSSMTINPTGVLTNDPAFNYQLQLYQAHMDKKPVTIPGVGVYDASTRFIRTSMLRNLVPEQLPPERMRSSNPPSLQQQRTQFAVQILNQVEVSEMEIDSTIGNYYTIWSTVRDHTNTILYWFNNMNHDLHGIDLKKINFKNGLDDEVSVDAGDWYTRFTVALSR